MAFDVDYLEFGEGDWEHGKDFVVEKVEVGGNEVVFVDGWGVFGFSDEEFCNVRKRDCEGFDGGEFIVVVVEGFAFGDEVFHLDGDGSGKVGHCCGEIFICLDLSDCVNRL